MAERWQGTDIPSFIFLSQIFLSKPFTQGFRSALVFPVGAKPENSATSKHAYAVLRGSSQLDQILVEQQRHQTDHEPFQSLGFETAEVGQQMGIE